MAQEIGAAIKSSLFSAACSAGFKCKLTNRDGSFSSKLSCRMACAAVSTVKRSRRWLLINYPKTFLCLSVVFIKIFFTDCHYRDSENNIQTFNLALIGYFILASILFCILSFIGVSIFLLISIPAISILVFTGIKVIRTIAVGIYDIFIWINYWFW